MIPPIVVFPNFADGLGDFVISRHSTYGAESTELKVSLMKMEQAHFVAKPLTFFVAKHRARGVGSRHFMLTVACLLAPAFVTPALALDPQKSITQFVHTSWTENETGATLVFRVLPAWRQTYWFLFLCVGAGLFLVWVVYSLRVRRIARVLSVRFDERLAERTRIARELHDTLLQTVQGSKFVADDALEKSGDSVHVRLALEKLSKWLGQATQEGRAALDSLRGSTIETNDLAAGLQRAAEERMLNRPMAVKFSVAGDARDMRPIVRDEIYRIGYEAIRNACEHSSASQLEVELNYAEDLTLRVIDNGIGIELAVLQDGKDGHFGLKWMRERAERIASNLTLVSSPNSGTEMTLVVPGGMIFRKENPTRFKRIKAVFRRTHGASNQN
jgi:signal transduction histidine kinase